MKETFPGASPAALLSYILFLRDYLKNQNGYKEFVKHIRSGYRPLTAWKLLETSMIAHYLDIPESLLIAHRKRLTRARPSPAPSDRVSRSLASLPYPFIIYNIISVLTYVACKIRTRFVPKSTPKYIISTLTRYIAILQSHSSPTRKEEKAAALNKYLLERYVGNLQKTYKIKMPEISCRQIKYRGGMTAQKNDVTLME